MLMKRLESVYNENINNIIGIKIGAATHVVKGGSSMLVVGSNNSG